jgi:hypothetical protein
VTRDVSPLESQKVLTILCTNIHEFISSRLKGAGNPVTLCQPFKKQKSLAKVH